MNRILVAGAGPAGLAAALHLARYRCRVILVEKESALGGKVRHFKCKQVAGVCTQCGACAVYELLGQAKADRNIECLTGWEVTGLMQEAAGVRVGLAHLAHNEEERQMEVDGVIIATGLQPFPASTRPETGYGSIRRVITALDLEQRAREQGNFAFLGARPRVAMIQCVGSRDNPGRGRSYCSRLCCLYGAKISRLIKQEVPEALIDAYCLDPQHYRDRYQAGWPEGVHLIRSMPGRIYRGADGNCLIKGEDGRGRTFNRAYDWVILCTALIPAPQTIHLGTGAGLDLNEDGFLTSQAPEHQRVWAAGGATGPLSFLECIESGVGAAGGLLTALTTQINPATF